MLPNEIYLNILKYCDETIQLRLTSKTFDSLCDIVFDPTRNNNHNLRLCTYENYNESIKKLLRNPLIDPSIEDNYLLKTAVLNYNLEIVKILTLDERVNFDSIYEYLLQRLFNNETGYKIMKVILKNPTFNFLKHHDYLITLCSNNYNSKLLNIILMDPRTDPSIHETNISLRRYKSI